MSIQNISELTKYFIEEFPEYYFTKDGKGYNKFGQEIGHRPKTEKYVCCNVKDKDGKSCKKRLHILIMWACSGEAPNGRECDHIDGDAYNNKYENLQYLDPTEHRRKTNRENSHIPILSGIAKRKKVVGENQITGEKKEFISMKEAADYIGYDPKHHGSGITKSVKKGTIVNGWKFTKVEEADIENETWKELILENNKSIYVSSLGRIRKDGKICKGSLSSGYNVNHIYNKRYTTHYLVCLAYHGKQPEWATSVNHINEDRLDNRPENLEWSNPKLQAEHSVSNKVILTKDDIKKEFKSVKDAGKFLEVWHTTISNAYTRNHKVKGWDVYIEKRRTHRKRGAQSLRKNHPNSRAVILIKDDEKREFESIQLASKFLEINESAIRGAIKRNGLCQGYKCLYKEDIAL